jgi:hypothetical protein
MCACPIIRKHWCACAHTNFPIFRKYLCACARSCPQKNAPARTYLFMRAYLRARAPIFQYSKSIGVLERARVLLKMRAGARNKSCAHMCACPIMRKHWSACTRKHFPIFRKHWCACARTHFPIFRKHWCAYARARNK